MRLLGTIVRLQYQQDHLKQTGEYGRFFSPANIVPVDELVFTPDGVYAGNPDDPRYDAHHTNHPRSRNRGDNAVSIGFTGHYAAMRARLGNRIADGIAGENILVSCDRLLSEADLAGGLVVETANGPVGIGNIGVAAPCVEFSRFAMQYPPEAKPDRTVSETLKFLHNGMRGFYATMESTATLRIGDRVFVRDAPE